jgi:hypothetical protein
MTDLARELGRIAPWVRLHYVYPYPHVDQVIPLMAEGLVLPYLDIPFQHASRAVLKAMRRPGQEAKVLERIRGWREICPDIAVRSTFIVGFPARPRRISNICCNGWTRRSSTGSARSSSSRWRARRPMRCPARCRRK